MDISRRSVLGGLAGVGVGGLAGAVAVTDGEVVDRIRGGDSDSGGDSRPSEAAVDPEAPFAARLSGDGGTDAPLFGASDLELVKGVFARDGEFLVQVVLSDAGVESFRDRLDEAGATDDPAAFTVSMTLDETEVRRVELDRETVDALTGSDWAGVLTFPFAEESVATSVYDRLADE